MKFISAPITYPLTEMNKMSWQTMKGVVRLQGLGSIWLATRSRGLLPSCKEGSRGEARQLTRSGEAVQADQGASGSSDLDPQCDWLGLHPPPELDPHYLGGSGYDRPWHGWHSLCSTVGGELKISSSPFSL